jgi:hypothetical protein
MVLGTMSGDYEHFVGQDVMEVVVNKKFNEFQFTSLNISVD